MKRRSVLHAAGFLTAALTAGCLGVEEDSPPNDTATTTNAGTTTRATTTRTSTTETTTRTTTEQTTPETTEYPPPDADDLTAEAETLQASAADSPARVTVTLTNAADHDARLRGGGTPPFTTYYSEEGALMLVPDERDYVVREDGESGGFVPESRTDGCWQSKARLFHAAVGSQRMLGPDDSISTSFTVLTNDECPPAGTYTFGNEIAVNDGRGKFTPLRELVVELALERNADGDITGSSATVRPLE